MVTRVVHVKCPNKVCNACGQLMFLCLSSTCCLCRQHADPPETVGQFEYWTEDNPHGHDSVKRRCLSTNQEQVLLSEAVLRDEAAQLSKMLRVPVAGGHRGTATGNTQLSNMSGLSLARCIAGRCVDTTLSWHLPAHRGHSLVPAKEMLYAR